MNDSSSPAPKNDAHTQTSVRQRDGAQAPTRAPHAWPPRLLAQPANRAGTSILITGRAVWTALLVISVLAIGYLLVHDALGALITIFIAIIVAEAMRPIVNALGRFRIPRPLGILLIYLGVFAAFGLLGWLIVPPVVNQAVTLANNAPDYVQQAQQLLSAVQHMLSGNPSLSAALQSLEGKLGDTVSGFVVTLINIPFNIIDFIASLLLILTTAFFWLTSSRRIKEFVLSLLPSYQQSLASEIITELSEKLGGYARGVIVNMTVIGVLTGVVMSLLGIQFALLLGILAGLFELLPFVGPWISGGVAVLVALATGGPSGPIHAVEVIIAFEIIQLLEGNALAPLVMSRAARLDPLVVIVSVIIGGAALGIAGAALAVPLAVVLQVLVTRMGAPLARRALGREAEDRAEEAATENATGENAAQRPLELAPGETVIQVGAISTAAVAPPLAPPTSPTSGSSPTRSPAPAAPVDHAQENVPQAPV